MGIGGSLGSGAVVAVVAGAAVFGAVVVGAGVLGAAVVGAGVDCCSGVWSREQTNKQGTEGRSGVQTSTCTVWYQTREGCAM